MFLFPFYDTNMNLQKKKEIWWKNIIWKMMKEYYLKNDTKTSHLISWAVSYLSNRKVNQEKEN